MRAKSPAGAQSQAAPGPSRSGPQGCPSPRVRREGAKTNSTPPVARCEARYAMALKATPAH
eukprot:5849873-Pyramimonas_sp.AAC.1